MILLKVPGQLVYRELVIRAVSLACKIARPSRHGTESESADPLLDRFTHEMVSAVGEAFNNVALHGYAGRSPGPVTMSIDAYPDRLEVQMVDDGASFDPATVPSPDLDGLPESGLGLFIIRSFVDTMHYRPGTPNVLTMVKCY